jgi:hypothetical protein
MVKIEKANKHWLLLPSSSLDMCWVAMLDALLWHSIALSWSRSLLPGENCAKCRADTERRASMA